MSNADAVPMPDERADAMASRDAELALVGERDPAEVQEATVSELTDLVTRAGDAVWARPAPDEWSAGEVIAHLMDIEVFMSARYRWILAHDDPPLVGFDPDLLWGRLP